MKKIIAIIALVTVSYTGFAQVGVGTNDPKAALDVVSTDSGFIMPRVADHTTLTVTTDHTGMQVYDTSTNSVWLYIGTAWVESAFGGETQWSEATMIDNSDPIVPVNVNVITADNALANGHTVMISDSGKLTIANEILTEASATDSGLSVSTTNPDASAGGLNTTVSNITFTDNQVYDKSYGAVYAKLDYEGTGSIKQLRALRSSTKLGVGSGNVEKAIANENVVSLATGYSGVIDLVIGTDIQINASNPAVATGTITDMVGLNISGSAFFRPDRAGLNRYGIKIENVNASTAQPGGVTYSIYTNEGLVSFGDDLELRTNGYLKVPVGGTAARPATPEAGMIRFNSNTSKFEGYDGTTWIDLH